MKKVIIVLNHEEALEQAHYRKANSNLARCYIELTDLFTANKVKLEVAKNRIKQLEQENKSNVFYGESEEE